MEERNQSPQKSKTPERPLSRLSLESKLTDAKEQEKIHFVDIITDDLKLKGFKKIEYDGLEQKYVQCENCQATLDNDQIVLEKHDCLTVKALCDNLSDEQFDEDCILSKPALQSAMADPLERDNVVLLPKESFKCMAWEYLDMVTYKGVSQPFAYCRYCRTLVSCSTKNNTSSIRKHVAKCSKIPRTSVADAIAQEDKANCEDGDEDEEDDFECDMFIPEVVYDDPAPGSALLDAKKEADNNNSLPILDCSFLEDSDDEGLNDKGAQEDQFELLDKFRLQELFEDPLERIHFEFEKPRRSDDAAYWKIFEYVIYRGIRQKYCKCTQCGVYINFVSTRRRGLARHMRSCNKKLSPSLVVKLENSPTKNNTATDVAAATTAAASTPNSSKAKKAKISPTPVKSATAPISPSTSTTITQSPQLAAALQQPQAVSSNINNVTTTARSTKRITPPIEFRNQLVLNQISFLATGLQCLDFLESPTFRTFAQNLITLGAEFGSHRIDEILANKETLLKYTIPGKVSKMKKQIKEVISEENHLSFSVDLFENKNNEKMNFKYFLTISCSVVTDNFYYKSFTLGTREFAHAIAEDIHTAFMKIVGEYFAIEDLPKRCYVVTSGHSLLDEAFEGYTCLPDIAQNLRDLFNGMLVSDDINPDILENVRKIQKLFAYLKINYNYYSSAGESVIDEIEEFYEMHEIIKKLLKEKGDVDRLAEISRHMMKTVINFLELVKLCLETLDDKSATVNSVLLWKKKLTEHYTPVLHEHKLTEDLKRKAIDLLETKLNTDYDLYKVALFLNPNFKSLKVLPPNERDQVHRVVREMIQSQIDSESAASQQPNIKSDLEPALKKPKIEKQLFADFVDNPHLTNGSKHALSIDAEIAKYSSDNKVYLTNDDLLEFWSRCKTFPKLRKLAKKVLSIPTCSNGMDPTVLLKANRSYREVYGQSLTIEEFHSVIFLKRNFVLLEQVD